MTEFYSIECPFDGSQEPTPYRHLGIEAKVPKKCSGCQYNMEARCKLIKNRLLRLDYGFCGISGSKELISDSRAGRKIPKKCSTCQYLTNDDIYKLACYKDIEIWGAIPRGLDF